LAATHFIEVASMEEARERALFHQRGMGFGEITEGIDVVILTPPEEKGLLPKVFGMSGSRHQKYIPQPCAGGYVRSYVILSE